MSARATAPGLAGIGLACIVGCVFASGCAAQAWPSSPTGVVDSSFAAHRRAIRTVDVLPVDLEVWSGDQRQDDADLVRLRAELAARQVVHSLLLRQGFHLASVIDWTGRASGVAPGGPPALAPGALMATLRVLGDSERAVDGDERLPAPRLPAPLGRASHADATLYVGGWSYLGRVGLSDEERDEARAAVKTAVTMARLLSGDSLLAVILDAARDDDEPRASEPAPSQAISAASGRFALCTLARAGRAPLREDGNAGGDDGDASDGCVFEPRTVVPSKGTSTLYLAMTLVDNRSGRALWHIHQAFPADASKPRDVQRAVAGLMATLPRARRVQPNPPGRVSPP